MLTVRRMRQTMAVAIVLTCVLLSLQYLRKRASSPTAAIVVEDMIAKPPTKTKANATIVMLTRNNELEGAVQSIQQLERQFNSKYQYPYVFLNEVPFSEAFKNRIYEITNSTVEFGLIPMEHWFQPDWIDEEQATNSRNRMMTQNVKYGDSVSYRNMCRFNSGFFYKHDLLQKYRWYWRVEPNVKFHCTLNYDPFVYMEANSKVYGFTITVFEIPATIPSLWGHVTDFIRKYPQHIAPNNSMGFLSRNGGRTYSTCHFWSNFEIADMDFWRGPAYTDFFDFLDEKGGFYYERWGDAVIHSIAAGLFLDRNSIYFAEPIGYQHDDWSHCPTAGTSWEDGQCTCKKSESFDYDPSSCKKAWDQFMRT
ncbi:glycosyltransferase family 15 protein [Mycena floridula]|nr:glycosyltransferase family 15 protein [Mycena floridula]